MSTDSTSGLPQPEQEIIHALQVSDYEGAAIRTLRAYGSEILGFLIVQLPERQHAEEVFSIFVEDLWRALPGLTLKSTMRAYAYALARNARHRYLARDLKAQRKGVPISQIEWVSELVVNARAETPPYLQTQNKNRLLELRQRLSADEQALLTLRIDRKLEWAEIAEVLDGEADASTATARQRKRFQLLKDKLTRWAKEDGWHD
jgi:RNA polymerase sigma-70 factor, ECF subfamily